MLRRAQQRAQNIVQTRACILVGGIVLWFWAFGVPFLGLDLIRMDVSNDYRRALQASHEDASSENIESAMHKRLERLTEEMRRSTRNDNININGENEDHDSDLEPAEAAAAAAAAAIAAEVATKQKQQAGTSSRLKNLRGLQSPLAGQRLLQGVPSMADSSAESDEESKELESNKITDASVSEGAGRLAEQADTGDDEGEAKEGAKSKKKAELRKTTQESSEEGSEGGESRSTAKDAGGSEPVAQGESSKGEASNEAGPAGGERTSADKTDGGKGRELTGSDEEDRDDSTAEEGPLSTTTSSHKHSHKSHYEERDGKASGHPTVESSDEEHHEDEHHEEQHTNAETQKEEEDGETEDDSEEATELKKNAKRGDDEEGKGEDRHELASDYSQHHREASQKAEKAESGGSMVSAHAEPGEGAEAQDKKQTNSATSAVPFIGDSSADDLASEHNKFSKWAQSTHYPKWRSLPYFPLGHKYTSDSLPRVMVVTARSPNPCTRDSGDFVLYRTLKNKMDYARMHGMEIVDVDAVVRPELDEWWQKVALMPMLMLRHPDIEWFFWVDADAVFTDLSFEIPWEKYASYHLVVYGHKRLVYREKDWNGLNGGVWLLRNSQESLALLKEWAEFGARGEARESWGKRFSQELKDRPKMFPADDQSALVWMMSEKPKKFRHLVYLEHDYHLHGDWENITDKLDDMWHAAQGSDEGSSLETLSKQHKLGPFITHFVGCKPCGGGILAESRRQRCQLGMDKALNFADNQLMAHYGLVHSSLTNSTLVPRTVSKGSTTQLTLKEPTLVTSAKRADTDAEEGDEASGKSTAEEKQSSTHLRSRSEQLNSDEGSSKTLERLETEGEEQGEISTSERTSDEREGEEEESVERPRKRRSASKGLSGQRLKAQAEGGGIETDEKELKSKSRLPGKRRYPGKLRKVHVAGESEALER